MPKSKIIFLLVFIWAISFGCRKEKKQEKASVNHLPEFIRNAASPDSGFITKKDGLPFLLNVKLTDSSKTFWNDIRDNDTIGKFYRVPKGGHYFVYLYNKSLEYNGECHTLLDIAESGKLLKHTDFLHGNHGCCLDNYYYDGFNKAGNLFALTTCGTGAGYCAGYLWLFNKVKPQEQQNSIYRSVWTSFGPESQYLSSRKEIKDDTLIMHYKLEKGELNDSGEFNVKKIEKFDIKYFLKNGKWVAGDSSKIKNTDIFNNY